MRSSSPRAARRATTPRSCRRSKRSPAATRSSPARSSIRPCWRSASTSKRTAARKVHYIGVDFFGRLDLDAYRAALSDKRRGRLDHVGQQRDRDDLPGRGPRRPRQGRRRAVSHRRRSGGRQGAGRRSRTARSTCCRCPATSCTRRRASARSMSSAASRFKPLFRGGHQERGRRAGTENIPGIVGSARRPNSPSSTCRRSRRASRRLRDRLEQAILQRVPQLLRQRRSE